MLTIFSLVAIFSIIWSRVYLVYSSPLSFVAGVPSTSAGMKSPTRPLRRPPRRSSRRVPTTGSATSRSANTGARRFVISFSTPSDSMKYASEGTSERIYSRGPAAIASTIPKIPSVIAVRVTDVPSAFIYASAVVNVLNWSTARPLKRGRIANS